MNLKKLEEKIAESGLKRQKIADVLSITRYGLLKKTNGETEFKTSEIQKLAKLLNLTKEEVFEIFL